MEKKGISSVIAGKSSDFITVKDLDTCQNCWESRASKVYRGRDTTSKSHGNSNKDSRSNGESVMMCTTSAMLATDWEGTRDKWIFA